MATTSTDRLLQQTVSESRDRFEMLNFLRRITLDVTNKLMIDVNIDDGRLSISHLGLQLVLFIIIYSHSIAGSKPMQ